jgi:predicted nucleic acid-binding protein
LNLIFDSDALIDHFRTDDSLEALESTVARAKIYMSSIVAMELFAGCRNRGEIRALERFMRPFERGGRVVTPSHSVYLRAGSVLSTMRRRGFNQAGRSRISNDLLIALSALSIGAAVITHNRSDYSLISRCVAVHWFGSVDEFMAIR